MKDAYCNNYLGNQTCRKENLIEKFFFQSNFLPVFLNILFDDIHECFISNYSRGSKIFYVQGRTIHNYLSDIPTFVDRPYHQHTQRYFCITVIEQDTKNILGEPSASL